MKKLLFLLLTTAISLSCSSDDSGNTVNSTDIIGEWRIIGYYDSYFDNIQQVEDEDDPCFSLRTKKYNEDSTFRDFYKHGNNCNNLGFNDKIYVIEGNVLTETEIGGGLYPQYDYVVKYEIQEITQTTVKLKGIYVDEGVTGEGTHLNDNPFYETWERVE